MPVVREASSFVPEIGTADTNDKRRSTESHLSGTSKEQERLVNACASELKPSLLEFFTTSVAKYANLETCAGRFSSFLRSKRTWRKTCKRTQIQSVKGKNCGGQKTRKD